jgi:hypothetical protein
MSYETPDPYWDAIEPERVIARNDPEAAKRLYPKSAVGSLMSVYGDQVSEAASKYGGMAARALNPMPTPGAPYPPKSPQASSNGMEGEAGGPALEQPYTPWGSGVVNKTPTAPQGRQAHHHIAREARKVIAAAGGAGAIDKQINAVVESGDAPAVGTPTTFYTPGMTDCAVRRCQGGERPPPQRLH